MKRAFPALTFCLLVVPLAARAADPPTDTVPKTSQSSTSQDDGNGNFSWSHRSSMRWGDAPPTGTPLPGPQAFPPAWAGGGAFPQGPDLSKGFYPGWNMPANPGMPPAVGSDTFFGPSSNFLSLQNVSLTAALAALQNNYRQQILLTAKAAERVAKHGESVSLSVRNQSAQKVLDSVLKGTQLTADVTAEAITITVGDEAVPEDGAELVRLNEVLLEAALQRPVTLTMIETPVPFVIQMLEGMNGVSIDIPKRFRSMFYTPQPRVTINVQQQPLVKVLEQVAKQIDSTVVVEDGQITLREGKEEK